MASIAENLERVRGQVAASASRAGRNPEEILLVAVSKTFGEEMVREALHSGQSHFGENYAQEFRRKATAFAGEDVRWHFIGHLQSNKAKDVVGWTHLIHSLDRTSLARELQKRAERLDITVDALVEVNTSGEATKSGVPPDAVMTLVHELAAFDRVRMRGLMTMGPFTDDPEDARPCFASLRDLRERLRQEGPQGTTFDELSMGMTGDFSVAIEEGATIIRIGTAIFGERTYHDQ